MQDVNLVYQKKNKIDYGLKCEYNCKNCNGRRLSEIVTYIDFSEPQRKIGNKMWLTEASSYSKSMPKYKESISVGPVLQIAIPKGRTGIQKLCAEENN